MDIALGLTEQEEDTNDRHASHFATHHDGSVFSFDHTFSPETFGRMLEWCSAAKVSDITIESDRHILAEIGGKILRITERPIGDGEVDGLLRHVYGDHATGVMKSGHDIDTAYEIRVQDRNLETTLRRYRINVTSGRAFGGGGDAKQFTIRSIPHTPPPIADLGIEQAIVDNIRPRQGMVLITGPTGSGKSTLAASMIRHIVEGEDANEKVLEYSRPNEFVYDEIRMPSSSVFQSEVGRHLRPRDEDNSERALFAYGARNALRRKPTIIVVGETRDQATMEATMEAATTGHLVYSTMHTNGVPSTLRRCLQFFPHDMRDGAAADLMETIRVVITQLLFPRKGGGMVALREFMIFDEKTRRLFAKKDVSDWPAFARNMMIEKRVTGQLMRDAAWKAFEKGLIDRDVFANIVRSEDHGA